MYIACLVIGSEFIKLHFHMFTTLLGSPCFFIHFLADRTIGRAYGTVCRLSSVTFCIVAKRYVLAKKCLRE